MTPLLRPVWWRASAGSFSSTATEIPGNRSVICIAVDSPTMPPPITARSKSAIDPPRLRPHLACNAKLYPLCRRETTTRHRRQHRFGRGAPPPRFSTTVVRLLHHHRDVVGLGPDAG